MGGQMTGWSSYETLGIGISNPRPVAKVNFKKPESWSDSAWDAYLAEVERRADEYSRIFDAEGEEAAGAYLDSLKPIKIA